MGTFESNVTDGGTWQNLYTGAYCNYHNDVSNVATYGRLYNRNAVADSPNTGATNESGFTALPGGYRNAWGGGFQVIGDFAASFCSSTVLNSGEPWARYLRSDGSGILRDNSGKRDGYAVRCIRD